MNTEEIRNILSQTSNKKFLVIGDFMLDHYTFGNVNRISPEAPIPVLAESSESFVPGGAGNVVHNAQALGIEAIPIGVVGNDQGKEDLFRLLKKIGVDPSTLLVDENRKTTVKRRFVSKNHQLLRVDEETTAPISKTIQTKLLSTIKKHIKDIDIVILSDYAKGLFTDSFTKEIITISHEHKKKIIADIKPSNKSFFKHVDVITPNASEAAAMTGIDDISQAGKQLVDFFHANVIITRSEEGMSIFTTSGERKDIPTKKIQVMDVSGAGDTVVTVLALGLASGLDLSESAELANIAASIVVQKPGTATVTFEELTSSLYEVQHIDEAEMHPKLWGFEKWLENNDKYCCKLLSLNKGYQCSLHYHNEKDEMFVVVKGHVRFETDDEVRYLREGNFVRILPGTKHRFRGVEDSLIIEVSTHHEESDSHRIEESRKAEA